MKEYLYNHKKEFSVYGFYIFFIFLVNIINMDAYIFISQGLKYNMLYVLAMTLGILFRSIVVFILFYISEIIIKGRQGLKKHMLRLVNLFLFSLAIPILLPGMTLLIDYLVLWAIFSLVEYKKNKVKAI